MEKLNGYDLSREFFNWCFENPEKITPTHIAMYFFIIEHCNRLGWKEKFGLPTTMVKDAIGIRNFRTYSNTLNDLVEWGFIKMIEVSKNQYSSNIIAIAQNTKAHAKALDKALQKHSQKQSKSIDSINKQETIEQETKEEIKYTCLSFDEFWDLYDKKVGKTNAIKLFEKTTENERELIKAYIPKYKLSKPEVKYRKDPERFLKYKVWEDEIISTEPEDKTGMFFINGQWHKKTPMQKYH